MDPYFTCAPTQGQLAASSKPRTHDPSVSKSTILITRPCEQTLNTDACSICLIAISNVAEWQRVRLRVRMVKGSTLTVGNFLSLENLNVIIRAITNWSNLVALMDWGGANSRFLGLVSVWAARSFDQTALRPSVIKRIRQN